MTTVAKTLSKHRDIQLLLSESGIPNIRKKLFDIINEVAKQEAIEFFKWNASKVSGYIEYIENVREKVSSQEIEEALNVFEKATMEERYELFLKSRDMESYQASRWQLPKHPEK